MNVSVRMSRVPVPYLIRAAAFSVGAVVIVIWAQLVIFEWVRHGPPDLRSFHQALQATVLGLIFAGYLAGLQNALLGGLMSLLGTVVFDAVYKLKFGQLFPVSWVWFAAPGLLYLIAWHAERRHGKLVL